MAERDLISELQQKRTALEADNAARKRLSLLFDNGYFIEIDAFYGSPDNPCEGVISGYGSIDGRLVYAYAQDGTVLNGAIGAVHAEKICRVMDLALATGAPLISIIDSGGARIDEGIDSMMALGKIISKTTELSGVVPQITAVMGTCCGGLAIAAQSADFVFATKDSLLFINGPKVIENETTEKVLLNAEENAKNACNIHFISEDDNECILQIKELLSYLPSNNLDDAPVEAIVDDINRQISGNTETIITDIADNGKAIEINSHYAKSIITAFIRLNGYTVGVVSNDGLLCNYSAKKAARFIRFCNCFNVPLLSLVDISGFVVGAKYEYEGLAQAGAKIAFAYAEATVPKVNVVIGNGYGSAYLVMNAGADMIIGWPNAQIAPMNPESAAFMLYNEQAAKADDPKAALAEKTTQYISEVASPYNACSKGYMDDIIEPSQTRQRVVSALDMLATKKQNKPAKVFSNIPL